MHISFTQNPELASSCMNVAKEFSNEDLRTHPSTKKVMSFFSSDAEFIGGVFRGRERGWPSYDVGKKVAEKVFKYLVEDNVVFFCPNPEVTFETKFDHIVWSFKSVQLRKGILPSWLKSPAWYKINNVTELYFKDTADGVKISKFVNQVNEWIPCKKPENVLV